MEEPAMDDDSGDKPFDDTPFDAGVEADEDTEPKKFIQQLSGKLGQTLRTYTQDVGMDLDLEKFAINSLLSATHTSEMDPEDQKDIIKRVENSGDEPEEEEDMEEPAPEMDGADVTGATNPASAPAPTGAGAPMGENFEVLDKEHKQVFKDAKLGVTESEFNSDDDFMSIADLERVEREIGSGINGHDMAESDEENTQKSLPINNKKDSFVNTQTDDAIRRMMDDYLSTQNGFEDPQTQPATKPQIMPETKPKVPRRSRPYRVNPNPNPTPKGKV